VIGIIAVVFIAVFYVMSTYNRLLDGQTRFSKELSDIDAALKRRYDLIRDMVLLLEGSGCAQSRLSVLEFHRPFALTMPNGVHQRALAETALSLDLRVLIDDADKRTALRKDSRFSELYSALACIEDELKRSARTYNGMAGEHNMRLKVFPGNVVAAVCSFRPVEFFRMEYAVDTPRDAAGPAPS
jgi:LemA protein